MFGSGKQTRDFVYVDDVVDALIAASTAERVDRSIINVGSGQEISIAQLVERMERVSGKQAHRLSNAEEESGVPRLVADVRLASELLKWKPRTSLDEGLQKMLKEDERFKK
jgi:UDP-glucose 4-epimerase